MARTNRDDIRQIVIMSIKTAMQNAPITAKTRDLPELIADEIMKQLDVSILSLPGYAVEKAHPSTILNFLSSKLHDLGE